MSTREVHRQKAEKAKLKAAIEEAEANMAKAQQSSSMGSRKTSVKDSKACVF